MPNTSKSLSNLDIKQIKDIGMVVVLEGDLDKAIEMTTVKADGISN